MAKQNKVNNLAQELLHLKGKEILVITESDQLSLFGESFRPIFCGKITDVEKGHITINPITIKMVNAPFFQFPIPLSIPLEKIVHFTTEISCDTRFPII
ncbi:hypothetical protein ACLIBH_07870 [Virgibacillus sp. W0430]|uniref:hypothetical protein n=1 Tax=Virgibacillus sp. W0430 TaxID=3391580 RepID=UPI003F46BF31